MALSGRRGGGIGVFPGVDCLAGVGAGMSGELLAVPSQSTLDNLPNLIDRAAQALSSARTSGEILEARDLAKFSYDAAKSAARIARAKAAHDEVIAAVYRAQADAALIEARAQIRLADEYDAAQERGEVKGKGHRSDVPDWNTIPNAADLGLSRKDIHEARQLRDAEEEAPGIIERALNERLEAGQEPTKTAIKEAVNTLKTGGHRTIGSGENEWYTPVDYLEMARAVMGGVDLDPASNAFANQTVQAERFLSKEEDGLAQPWAGRIWLNPPYSQPAIYLFVEKLVEEYGAGNVSEAILLTHNFTDTRWFHLAANASTALCFTKGRIRFVNSAQEKAAPTCGQTFFYFGCRPERFGQVFSEAGLILRAAA